MRSFFTILFLIFWTIGIAQKQIIIPLQSNKTVPFQIEANNADITIKSNIPNLEANFKTTKSGDFFELLADGLQKQYGKGQPNIPIISKLIEVPGKDKYNVSIQNFAEQLINLSEYNIDFKIEPAQLSISKSEDERKVPHYFNEEMYELNKYLYDNIVTVEYVGEMRGRHLARVELYPIQYNPRTNQLKILQDLEISIHFDETINTKSTLQSEPFDNVIKNQTINNTVITNTKSLATVGPIKYVIIADRMFEATLQDFIEWKTISGFQVIVGYTDDSEVGNTTTTIKAYLKDLYENPPAGEQAPSYVLFVGDIDQIPSFSTQTGGSHVTDLHYCEYTNDYLPEVLYGRFSAESVSELEPQIAKTIIYEQYTFPDNSFIDDVVLVAGVEPGEGVSHGNGQINYLSNEYFNVEHGFDASIYLYSSGSEITSDDSEARAAILNDISAGTGFANYTAHCSSDGWANPSFSRSDISNLTNIGKFGTMIGNCCESNKFNVDDCFGEKIVQADNKGAVGYIGGNDLTYWDEDFIFAVGLNSIAISSANANAHTYENTGLGLVDGLFHDHGEATSDWYITNSQLIMSGNLAIEASTSSLKNYYWEVYSLFGDPSLMTYMGIPTELMATYNNNLPVGTSNLTVTTNAYAHVTLSENGEILDSQIADASGIVSLTFDPLTTPGTDQLDMVITGQNKIPHIENITVISPTGPYIIINNVSVIDDENENENENSKIDFGEYFNFDIEFKNVGQDIANNVTVTIISTDENIVNPNLNISINIGTIAAGETKSVSDKFYFIVTDNIEDQHQFTFNSSITDDSGDTYTSDFIEYGNAPILTINEITIDDNDTGNNDGILDVGESAKLKVSISNQGSSNVTNINSTVSYLNGSETYVNFDIKEVFLSSLPANNNSYSIEFPVVAYENVNIGTIANFNVAITAGENDQYSVTENSEISISEIPEFRINDGGTNIVDYAYFYDTGGEFGNYDNDENYIITFIPKNTGNQITANFEFFSIEEYTDGRFWDSLIVYNGLTTNDELIGIYFTDPGTIVSNNINGALTFRFSSDAADIEKGWKALITQNDLYDVSFTVNDGTNALKDASVLFNNEEKTTDTNGDASFLNLINETTSYYLVSKTGYSQVSGTVTINNSDVSETVTLTALPIFSTNFVITNQTNPLVGAKVVINEETIYTDINGHALFYNLYDNVEYSYEISSEGYVDKTGTFTLDGANMNIPIELSKIPKYKLTFNITYDGEAVENATISIGDSIKKTDIDGKVSFHFYNGTYEYSISAESFNDVSSTFIIQNSDLVINKLLIKQFFNIKLKIVCSETDTTIENASFIINEEEYLSDSVGIINLHLEYGTYNISGIAYGYDNYLTKQLEIIKDSLYILEMNLHYYNTTFIIINEEEQAIPNAQISIIDSIYYANYNGIKSFPACIGNYNYSIAADGYEAMHSNFTMQAKDTAITVVLSRIKYNIEFNVTNSNNTGIEGAEISIKNLTDTTDNLGKLNLEIEAGNYVCIINAAGYFSDTSLITINSDSVFYSTLQLVQYNVEFEVLDENNRAMENVGISVGQKLLNTDNAGKAILTLIPGEYSYSIRIDGYEDIIDKAFTISDSSITELVILEPVINSYTLTFNVYNSEETALEGAAVTVSAVTKFTNSSGIVLFDDIQPGISVDYIISMEGYESDTGNIENMNSDMDIRIYLNSTSGILSNNITDVQIYPNPTDGKIFVSGIPKNSILSIYDITGNQIISQSNKQKDIELNFDFVEKGLYILEIKSTNQQRVFRLVKN
jgi:Peptidase family C25/Propeptide_C25/Peptidase family C25, C terminal ig-like domain/Secretion system C-terminal sorting domain